MKNFLCRKDNIIISAIDIINELGLQGLSIKEIASRQGINESALYRHFKNKDSIINGVLDYFTQYDNAIYNTVIKKDISIKEKILFYAKSYIEYYQSYPAITGIWFSYEAFRHEPVAMEKIDYVFTNRLNSLVKLIEEGQVNGEINYFFTAKELAEMIFGFLRLSIYEWRVADFSIPFKDSTLESLNKLLICAEKNDR